MSKNTILTIEDLIRRSKPQFDQLKKMFFMHYKTKHEMCYPEINNYWKESLIQYSKINNQYDSEVFDEIYE